MSETTGVGISKTTYIKFARQYKDAQKAVDEAQEDRGEVMKGAADASIHKGAFKLAQKLARMEVAAAQEFLTCLEVYCGWEGIKAQDQLPLEPTGPEAGGGKANGSKKRGHAEGDQLGA